MSRSKTQMWCPTCRSYQGCNAVKPENPYDAGQRWELSKDRTIYAFRRERECAKCEMRFTTYEVEQYVIYELLILRKLVASLNSVPQDHAEKLRLAGRSLEKAAAKVEKAAAKAVKEANAEIERNDGIYEFLLKDSLGWFR